MPADAEDPTLWQEIDVCSLGMFIIDEIYYRTSEALENNYRNEAATQEASDPSARKSSAEKVLTNIMGGAGSYTALGARIFSTRSRSRRVGWIVDCGSDFSASMRTRIESWETSCLFRTDSKRLTTRGWNGYGDGASEHRAFRYMTPKLRLDEESLTPELLLSRSFHLICSPLRCQSLIRGILKRRAELLAHLNKTAQEMNQHWHERPLFIWEPVPDLCKVEEWQNCKETLRMVDCISPNHAELAGFFGLEKEINDRDGNVNAQLTEELAMKIIHEGVRGECSGAVIVRAGKDGCCVASRALAKPVWLPAYHEAGNGKVLDPTGGGNAFLGGLAAALSNQSTVELAAAAGSIVAGVAIEQTGMPILDVDSDTWNGLTFTQRSELYQQRLTACGSTLKVEIKPEIVEGSV